MTRKVLLASLIGAILLFGWAMVSWTMLPYHGKANLKFNDEEAVVNTINSHAEQAGVYLLPNPHHIDATLTPDAQKTANEKSMALLKKGPVVFVTVQKHGVDSMNQNLMIEFANDWLATFLFCILLLFLKPMGYFCRLTFVYLFAVTLCVVGDIPNWNWWHFSDMFILTSMADKVVSWMIAGMVMSYIVKPKSSECKSA